MRASRLRTHYVVSTADRRVVCGKTVVSRSFANDLKVTTDPGHVDCFACRSIIKKMTAAPDEEKAG